MRTKLLILLLALASSTLSAQFVDDGYDPNVGNGSVNTLANGPNGEVWAGGTFTSVDGQAAQRLARIGIGGQLISTFPQVNNTVHATLGTNAGEYWIGGSFTQVEGATVPRVARRRANGQAVPGFTSPVPNSTVRALAEAAGDRVYIGGQFTEVGGQPRSRVARVNANGSLDASFAPPEFNGTVYALAEQSDGKLIIAGNLQRVGDIAARRLYRLNADGSWDSSFLVTNIVSSPFTIFAVAIQDDGKIVVAGDFGGYIRRYHSDGSLDTDFTPPSLNGAVRALALQPDGRLIFGGDFTGLSGRNRIARLNEDGSLDNIFASGLGTNDTVRALSLQPDGSVVIGGDFTSINAVPRNRIARLDANGRLHRTLLFGGTTNGAIRALAVEPDGNLLVGGDFSVFNGQQRRALVRVGETGQPVSGFAPGFPLGGGVNAIALQPDGRILLAGTFLMIAGAPGASSWGIGRLHPDGSYDLSFSSPIDQISVIESMLLQDDGRIMIGGNFVNLGGQSLSGLARLNNDGSIDPSFQPPEFDDTVLAIIQDGVGGYLVGGRFSSPRPNLVRLLADGTLDESFLPNTPNQEVRALAIARSGTLVGGSFTSIGGQACHGLARMNLSGQVSANCPQSGQHFPVRAIVPRADGSFLVLSPSRAILLETPTQAFPNFLHPWVDAETERLNTAIFQPDGRLVVGGQFDNIRGQTRRGLARFSLRPGDNSLEQSITWNQNTGQVRWQRAPDSAAPEVIGRPRLMVSAVCCDPATFSPVAGSGVMTRSGDDWILNGFSGQPGRFYLAVDFGTGHPGGIGSNRSRTPAYRMQGPEPPPITADLSVIKQAQPGSVAVGETVTFRVTASNNGPSPATEVAVIDQLPGGFTLIDFDLSIGSYDPTTGEWKISDMPVGMEAELVMIATAEPNGPYVNTAQIFGAEFDPVPENNIASVSVEVVQPRADLSISKSAQPDQALPGQTVRFDVSVENLGPDNATGVVVTDQLPSGFTYSDHQTSSGSYDPVSGLWQVGSLVAGQQQTLSINVEVNPLGDHTNVAWVSAVTLDPIPDNNSAAATVDVPQIPVGQIAALDFGSAPVGSSALRTGILRSTGNGPLVVTGPVQLAQNSGGSYVIEEDLCLGLTLLPDERCFVDVVCTPGATGPQPGLLRIVTNAGAIDAPLSCTGTAPGLLINPGSVNFGQQPVGQASTAQTVTLSNNGQISLSLSNIILGGSHANNFNLTNGCGSSLAPGSSCSLQVVFTPSTTGTRSASIQIVSNAPSSPDSVSLTGVGTQPNLQINPGSVNFGQQPVGQASSAQSVSLSNTGQASLSLSNISLGGSHANNFNLTNGCGSSLAPGASCNLQVVFTPSTTGTRNATITIVSNAPSSPDSVSLTGVGTQPSLQINPGSLNFGQQPVGQASSAQSVSLSNSGQASLSLSNISLGGSHANNFSLDNGCGSSLAPGASCNLQIVFTPSTTGTRNASIQIVSNAPSSPDSVSLTGVGTQSGLQIDPGSLDFGQQPVGQASSSQTVSLSNTGQASLSLSNISLGGSHANNFNLDNGCGSTLAPGASCSLEVVFTPSTTGTRNASIQIVSNAPSSPDSVSLTGIGTQPGLQISPSSVNFGQQQVGQTSSSRNVSLSNTGQASLSFSNITLSGSHANNFNLSNGCGSSLAPGASCNLQVTFTPSTTGTRSASIQIVSNAPSSPDSVNLTGTGIKPDGDQIFRDRFGP